MNMKTVTLTLQDDVYRRAAKFAQLANLKVNDVLSDVIELSLLPPNPQPSVVKPVSELSDKEVLKLTELQMAPAQDRRLSRLLNRQQAGKLMAEERAELLTLMQVYQDGLLRKAQALAEAVRRGLREPLTP
jgi:predicted CopG family antitoxin